MIKVGGSLLDLPDLAGRLERWLRGWLEPLATPRPLLVCGGGRTVDVVRAWDRTFGLGDEPGHWLAIHALSVNSRLLAQIVERCEYTTAPARFGELWESGRVPIYDAFAFLSEVDERGPAPLPRAWRVTSDSIAARMAERLGAPELVLLKSAGLPAGRTVADAVADGVFDPYFVEATRALERVWSVNLRDPAMPRVRLQRARAR